MSSDDGPRVSNCDSSVSFDTHHKLLCNCPGDLEQEQRFCNLPISVHSVHVLQATTCGLQSICTLQNVFRLEPICTHILNLLQAKSRVLESICTGIRERYKALNLPPELAVHESQAADVVGDMIHPDQRAIGAAGRKVLAMFETISQFCQKAQQVCLLRLTKSNEGTLLCTLPSACIKV